MQEHVTMEVTKEALVLRIPWNDVAHHLRPSKKKYKTKMTAREVLEFVKEGRAAYRAGRIKSVRSLNELR